MINNQNRRKYGTTGPRDCKRRHKPIKDLCDKVGQTLPYASISSKHNSSKNVLPMGQAPMGQAYHLDSPNK